MTIWRYYLIIFLDRLRTGRKRRKLVRITDNPTSQDSKQDLLDTSLKQRNYIYETCSLVPIYMSGLNKSTEETYKLSQKFQVLRAFTTVQHVHYKFQEEQRIFLHVSQFMLSLPSVSDVRNYLTVWSGSIFS